jgi:nucleoside-diphosphate-sugar epimerase
VKSVCKLFDYDFNKVKRDLTVPPGMKKKNISNKKLMKILGSFEFTNLDKGLKNTIEYYKTKIR